MRDYKHLTVFPGEDKAKLKAATKLTGLSVNQIIVRSVHTQLPALLAEAASKTGRLTNVEPLPDHVLDKLYRERDDDPEGIEALMAAQPIHSEE